MERPPMEHMERESTRDGIGGKTIDGGKEQELERVEEDGQ